MRNLAKCNDHAEAGQRRQRAFEKGAAAADFFRCRLVAGRQAFDSVEDYHPVRRLPLISETEFGKRRPEQVASSVAGERPARPVRAMLTRCEANDCQPGVRIAKRWHRRIPPFRVGRTIGVALGY